MSDSHYCHVHWRVTELVNVDTEWESEELPDDEIIVPLNLQPLTEEGDEQASFEQHMLEMEDKWLDHDLPVVKNDPKKPSIDTKQ
ncbi:hypothetical protein CPC16_007074 [Podila verticillata]|nr:hypothetical protein CPC16_007074 [Podila verticillata]